MTLNSDISLVQIPMSVVVDHVSWRNSNTNVRGAELFDYVASNFIFVSNIGDQPTFSTSQREEAIDFTFTNFLPTNLRKN